MPFLVALLLTLVIAVGGTGTALAQGIPNHTDPTARENVPNLAAVQTIRFLTTPDFPPFNYRDQSGELVGFNIDLARALCADLSITCTIQAWPWAQAPQALEDGQGDALIAGLALDSANGQRFDFSDLYLMLPGRFVTTAADVAGFDPSLEGLTISVRRGSAHETFLRRYFPKSTLSLFDSELDALEALRSGAVKAWFGDAMRASFWLNQSGACCGFAGAPYFRPDLFGEGLAIAMPLGHDSVRAAIDYGLARLKKSGAYDEIYLRWFPISFY